MRTVEDREVLLYDGLCPMCNAAVRFVLRNDADGATLFSPLGGRYATEVAARHPHLAHEDSVILVTQCANGRESIRLRSDALLTLMSRMKGWSIFAKVVRVLPRAWRDGMYDVIARWRTRWSGRYDECPLPDASVRHRFIP